MQRNSPDTAEILHNWAQSYAEQGQYAEAEALYVEARDIRLQIFGSNDLSVASTLSALAQLYTLQERYAEAEPLLLEARGIYQQTSERDTSEMSVNLNALGQLYLLQERYAEAEAVLIETRDITEQNFGHNHLETARTLRGLGQLYIDQDRYDEAEPLITEALEIMRQTIGLESLDTAAAMGALASLYAGQGDYARAEQISQEALEIMMRTIGPDHIATQSMSETFQFLSEISQQETEGEAKPASKNYKAPKDLLYPLQSYDYETGMCADGRQVVMGLLCPNLVAFFFDMQGNLLGKELRLWKHPARFENGRYHTYEDEFEAALEQQKTEWQAEIGFQPDTIRVKHFFDAELLVGIELLPDHYLELETTDWISNEEERQEYIKDRDSWLENGNFVWWWARDYYMSAEGEVEST